MIPSTPLLALLVATLACSHSRAPDAAVARPAVPAPAPAPPVEAPPRVAPAADPPGPSDACREDRDCAPIACCAPITADGCVGRASAAASCDEVECAAPVVSELRCACRVGRCVGLR